MDCVIVRETPQRVLVNVGMGEVSFSRSRVAEIVRQDRTTNDALLAAWRKQFAPPPPLPDEWQALAKADRHLVALRKQAVNAYQAQARDQKRSAQLQHREKQDVPRFHRLGQELARDDATRDRARYTKLVEDYNQLVAGLNVNRKEQADIAMRQEKGRATVRNYLKTLALTSAQYREETEEVDRAELEEHVVTWLDTVEGHLQAFNADFSRLQVPVKREGRSLVVTARVNDRGTGTFIVDTGATLVTLSAAAAERLGVDYRSGAVMRMSLADGSEREGRGVMLRSLAVGDAREVNVPAAVMDDPPAGGVDGLLGMSFLGKFMMSLDGPEGGLVLKRFQPG